MALVCVQCKMLCVIFLLICSFSSIYSLSDIYLYDTPASVSSKTFEQLSYKSLYDNEPHILRKRQTEDSGGPTTTTTTTIRPISSSTTTSSSVTTNQTQIVAVTPATTEHPDSKILLNKNLGVNGTGIRKNITRDSINKSTVNLTALVHTELSNPNATDIRVLPGNQTSELDDDNNDDETPLSSGTIDLEKKVMVANHINANNTKTDIHTFYNSTLSMNQQEAHKYWVNMNRSDAKISDLLSQSHRRAATVRLSFDFPFYGHIVRNITIATGGFLYTGEYVHSWLAATQYIAPLMANFDTSLSNDSYIKYYDNGTAFTVLWEKVALQDKPKDGNFTFQTTLHRNGDIVFVYENIPISIGTIQDDHHPVKVGLSDAYISDRTIFFVRRKTIYEYHRVNFNREHIQNWTMIYLKALPTCLSNKDCLSCVSKPTSSFQCFWCPGTNRCSSGMDRNRQGWLSKGCDRKKITNETQCATAAATADNDSNLDYATNNNTQYNTAAAVDASNSASGVAQSSADEPRQEPRITHSEQPPEHMGTSGIILILIIVSLAIGLSVWVLYAYRNPHSTSGQILIRYRPSQWSWKRGEARYTAATIHM